MQFLTINTNLGLCMASVLQNKGKTILGTEHVAS
jgi:hypothetical protein